MASVDFKCRIPYLFKQPFSHSPWQRTANTRRPSTKGMFFVVTVIIVSEFICIFQFLVWWSSGKADCFYSGWKISFRRRQNVSPKLSQSWFRPRKFLLDWMNCPELSSYWASVLPCQRWLISQKRVFTSQFDCRRSEWPITFNIPYHLFKNVPVHFKSEMANEILSALPGNL